MIYLQANSEFFGGLPFLIAIGAIFYFLILRPQLKKQKDQDKFSKSIEKGQEIVTNSGIIGKIKSIDGNKINIETAGKTHLEILSSAVSKELTEALNPAEVPEKKGFFG